MKKLLGILVLGLLLASCTDRYDDHQSSFTFWVGVIGSILFIFLPFLYGRYEDLRDLSAENKILKDENEELKKKSKKRKKRKS